jgi:hypothetical protein
MEIPMQMKSFDAYSQQVWAANTVAAKKEILLQMVEQFHYKGKFGENVGAFKRSINACNSLAKLDSMAAQLALNSTDKVIK